MKKVFIILILIFSCKPKIDNRNIDIIYNECYNNSVTVNGKPISFYRNQYENILIRNNVMKDNSPKSYFELYNILSEYEYIDINSNYVFKDSIKNMNVVDISKCIPLIKDKIEYKKSIFNNIIKEIITENGNVKSEIDYEKFTTLINQESFEYDYFKEIVLKLIKPYSFKTENNIGIKIKFFENNFPKGLKFEFKNGTLYCNNKKIKNSEIFKLSKKQIENEKSNSFFSIKSEKTTSFLNFIKIRNEISKASEFTKDKKAFEKYKKSYYKLEIKEKNIIDSLYNYRLEIK